MPSISERVVWDTRPRRRYHFGLAMTFAVQSLTIGACGTGESDLAYAPPTGEDVATLFRDVRVFDGADTIPTTSVLVRNGTIAAIGSMAGTSDVEIVDGRGRTLLPGLIDSHVHFRRDGLREAMVFGVTTELDMFTPPQFIAAAKAELMTIRGAELADLRSAGTLVTAPGGHGTQYGFPIPTITAAEQAEAFVDARLAEGSDYIKLVYDDGSVWGRRIPTLSVETMTAVIAAAHGRNRLAVVHIATLQGARDALSAGADGLVHLFVDLPPDPGFGSLVSATQAFVIPTLTVLESASGTPSGTSLVSDPLLAPYITANSRTGLASAFPVSPINSTDYHAAVEALHQLKAHGVPILAGSDAPNPGTAHGVSIHRELELLVQGGLTPSEALTAATAAPAKAFRLTDRGRISVGLRADLLLVNGDPTVDIRATRDIVAVWRTGVHFERWRHLQPIPQ